MSEFDKTIPNVKGKYVLREGFTEYAFIENQLLPMDKFVSYSMTLTNKKSVPEFSLEKFKEPKNNNWFTCSNVTHATSVNGLAGMVMGGVITGGEKNPILDPATKEHLHNMTWFTLTPDVDTPIRNESRKTPPFNRSSRYGQFKLMSGLNDLIADFKKENGCDDVSLKIMGTKVFKYEIAYAIVLSTGEDAYKDFPALKSVDNWLDVSYNDIGIDIRWCPYSIKEHTDGPTKPYLYYPDYYGWEHIIIGVPHLNKDPETGIHVSQLLGNMQLCNVAQLSMCTNWSDLDRREAGEKGCTRIYKQLCGFIKEELQDLDLGKWIIGESAEGKSAIKISTCIDKISDISILLGVMNIKSCSDLLLKMDVIKVRLNDLLKRKIALPRTG